MKIASLSVFLCLQDKNRENPPQGGYRKPESQGEEFEIGYEKVEGELARKGLLDFHSPRIIIANCSVCESESHSVVSNSLKPH